jgi:predicted dehydrogenase
MRVALIGAGFISRIYVGALRRVADAEIAGVASRTLASAEKLAREAGVDLAVSYDDLPRLLADPSIDVVCVNSTNRLHAEHAIAASRAGKHVIVEKPMCLRLAEADAMLAAARAAGKGLGYAENLCFIPHYREARDLIASGALGQVSYARQCEKHGGPYSPWFFDLEEAGGGALLDMGCHSVECLRWLFGKPRVTRVQARIATVRHEERGPLDDDAVLQLEFEGGLRVISESSWALEGGMQSTLEVHGSEGTLHVDLLGSTGMRLYRRERGWTTPHPDPLWINGNPQALEHFLGCFSRGVEPEEGGADGRAVLEILLAAYASARDGEPKTLPFDPAGARRPAELWLSGSSTARRD